METNLLATKLYIPTPRQNFIRRGAVLEKLDRSMKQKLTLVAAPPGYGKTTLLSIWAKRSDMPVAWLSLDREDNDPSLFFQYLIAALQTIAPQLGGITLAQLRSPQPPSQKTILATLINDLDQYETEFALVLDDYHEIEEQGIHTALNYLVDHQPEKMHLLIASRSDPPLKLSRLRARSQLLELRQTDLRMNPQEASQFLQESMGLNLSPDQVNALESRTEGWIAGLQLAALSLRNRHDIDEFIDSFSGSHRFVIDYLADEVFSQQAPEIQSFLTRVAILDRISAPLCNLLTSREDSSEILQILEDSNIFLVPLDDQRVWYRFHHLFVDYLRTTSPGQDQELLHKIASQWFLEKHLYGEAIKHARSANEMPLLIQAINKGASTSLEQGNISSLTNWLDSLPEEILLGNSQLSTYKGFLTFFSKSPELARPYAEAAQQHLPSNPTSSLQGQLMSLQAHLALCFDDADTAVRLSRESLEFLDDDDLFFRNLTLNILGQVLEMKGDVESASGVYQQAFITGERAGDQLGLLVILTNLVFSLNELGQRTQALAFCEELAVSPKWRSGSGLDLLDGIYLPWSQLSYEANQLDTAQEQVQRALQGVERVYIAQGKLWGLYILARIHLAKQDYANLEKVITKGKQLARRIGSQQIHYTWFETLEAQANLDRGEISAVEHWAEQNQLFPDAKPHHWHEHQYFTFIRLLLTQERWGDAEGLLNSMADIITREKRYRKLITLYLLKARLEKNRSRDDTALKLMENAVDLARPQDYRRAFFDEGPVIISLLAGMRGYAPGFVNEILGSPVPGRPAISQTVQGYEPLSERELEILRLVARGYSNRQVAEVLFISLGTVKKHLNNIFGKLQVTNRTEAVVKARELGLLE